MRRLIAVRAMCFAVLWVWVAAWGGCGGPDEPLEDVGEQAPPAASGPVEVFVSIPPQADLVRRIGGARARVRVLVPKGDEPHDYAPTPEQIMSLGKARLYFAVGAPFEKALLAKLTGPYKGVKVVDTTAGIARRGTQADGGEAVARGLAADPHVWLGPPELAIMAAHVARGLGAVDPSHAEKYQRSLAAFKASLDALDAKIRRKLAPFRGSKVYVFHPAFGYFARAYGLEQVAVEREGKPPAPKDLEAFIRQARADGVKVIFVQPQFDQTSARKVAVALRGDVVTVDPLAENVLANLTDLADKVARALGEARAPVGGERAPDGTTREEGPR